MLQRRAAGIADLQTGMHVIITGSGSGLIDPQRGGASAAVLVDGEILQFDCGRLVMENLALTGINPVEVDRLFLTHLHFDHIASYGYFVISSWIAGRQDVLPVYGPAGTAAMSKNCIFGTHAVDVRFIEGLVDAWPKVSGCPRRTAPIEVREIEAGIVVAGHGYTVMAAPTQHYREHGIISYAYRVDCRHGSVVVTGDGRPCPELVALARSADLLVAECAKPDSDMIRAGGKLTREKPDGPPSGGHMTPSWLGRMAAEARVKAVVASHLGPFTGVAAAFDMSKVYYGAEPPGDDFWDRFLERIRTGFDGPVQLARDGLVIRVGAGAC
jgi:ribonuclease Z